MAMLAIEPFTMPTPAHTETFEGRHAPAIPLGLSAPERADLEWYFCAYEADIGVRSTFREMVEVVGGAHEASADGPTARSGSSHGNADVHAHDERMLALHFRGVFARANGIYQALKATPSHHLTVLWLLHGPARPNAPHAVFGDVAPIVHLTDTVEAIREQMATRDGEARYETVSADYGATLEIARRRIARQFWEAAGDWQKCLSRAAARADNPKMQSARGKAITLDLERRRDAWRVVMSTLLHAYRYDGSASAQATAMGAADRELSPQAAIRWALDYRGPRGIDGKPHPEAHKAHLEARKTFERNARKDAERLRIGAAIAYRAARKAIKP